MIVADVNFHASHETIGNRVLVEFYSMDDNWGRLYVEMKRIKRYRPRLAVHVDLMLLLLLFFFTSTHLYPIWAWKNTTNRENWYMSCALFWLNITMLWHERLMLNSWFTRVEHTNRTPNPINDAAQSKWTHIPKFKTVSLILLGTTQQINVYSYRMECVSVCGRLHYISRFVIVDVLHSFC